MASSLTMINSLNYYYSRVLAINMTRQMPNGLVILITLDQQIQHLNNEMQNGI